MAGISGLGSGIDIDSIVTALVNAERAPKQGQLDRLEKTTTERISAVGTLLFYPAAQNASYNLLLAGLFTQNCGIG